MRKALISVTDKSGLIPFVQKLIEKKYQIISTGGTYKTIVEHGLPATRVEEITGFKEIFDGRVKTLHPKIHGALLGKRNLNHHIEEAHANQIEWIDLAVINLYPFVSVMKNQESTDDMIIENIDIGGPSMIRSAAKNHESVAVVTDIKDYDWVIDAMDENGSLSFEIRRKLAAKAFRMTAQYDAYIASYLTKDTYPEALTLTFTKKEDLRYGENPHQSAALYQSLIFNTHSISNAEQLHGKSLSYNNIQDATAALEMIKVFQEPCVVAIKHMNPCGIGCGLSLYDAWKKAYQADPISIFGGIVAFNQQVSMDIAQELGDLFLEVIIAPNYDAEALKLLSKKKQIRILKTPIEPSKDLYEFKSLDGGLLIQQKDQLFYEELSFPTDVKPSDEDLKELLFAFKVVQFVKSNAIVIANHQMTLGIGAGQMNRVGAAKIALEQAGIKGKGAYMASDAFFPMADTVEIAIQAGIKAIIQPGGSIKDQDSIDVCNRYGIPMVFTKTRHFRH
jgi:phosphoribosylaminoimidazolecarboxamide formyltransferase / IMP cyclohydrolase